MSTLNVWLSVGALVAVILYMANALVYRRRFGTFLRPEARAAFRTRSLTLDEIALLALITGALVVGVGAPYVVPDSKLALWLQEPYSLVLYVVWCSILCTVLGILLAALRHVAAKR